MRVHQRDIKKRVARESLSQRETEDPSTTVSRREVEGKQPRNQRKRRAEQKAGTSVGCKASVIFVLGFFSLQVAENEVR